MPASIEQEWRYDNEPSAGAPPSVADSEPLAAPVPVPFFVLAGLMGSERNGHNLPSHAGMSMPTRFDAPIAGLGRSGLIQAASFKPTRAGPSIPSKFPAGGGAGLQPRGRPDSAPSSKARPGSAKPQQSRPMTAAATSSRAQPPPPSAASWERYAAQADDALGLGVTVTGSSSPSRPRAAQPSVPPLQTLDRVLQKELAYGRLGFPSGHYRAPTNQLPATFHASLMRGRGKSKLRDMTMIPTTLRAWESSVERQTAVRRGVSPPRGYGRAAASSSRPASASSSRMAGSGPGSAAAAASEEAHGLGAPVAPRAAQQQIGHAASTPASQQPPPAPTKLTPYEMRRFLQHSQKYFLAVSKQPFCGAESVGGGARH